MDQEIEKFITQFTFVRKYGLLGLGRYKQFLSFVSTKMQQSIDKETKLVALSLKNKWKDHGGNTHVSIQGKISRRNEVADIGAEIVWLKNLQIFRGGFWSHLNPKSDLELFSEAKLYFHAGMYAEFLSLAKHIELVYSKNRIFNRMLSIAERRL